MSVPRLRMFAGHNPPENPALLRVSCDLCGELSVVTGLATALFAKKPFFGLAIAQAATSFGVRFSFFWQAVGAPVPCQKPLFRGIIGRKTQHQHNPEPNTS